MLLFHFFPTFFLLLFCIVLVGDGSAINEATPSSLEHKGYITSIFPTQATGEHVNLPGHSIDNVTVIIRKNNESYKKKYDKHHT